MWIGPWPDRRIPMSQTAQEFLTRACTRAFHIIKDRFRSYITLTLQCTKGGNATGMSCQTIGKIVYDAADPFKTGNFRETKERVTCSLIGGHFNDASAKIPQICCDILRIFEKPNH